MPDTTPTRSRIPPHPPTPHTLPTTFPHRPDRAPESIYHCYTVLRTHSLQLSPTSAATAQGPSSGSLEDKVRRVIELIRPAVQADGGDVEFVGLTADNTVQIRMHGACVGCPSSTVTLQTGIERNLKAHIPEIKGIQALDS